jgi:hypothetical protein
MPLPMRQSYDLQVINFILIKLMSFCSAGFFWVLLAIKDDPLSKSPQELGRIGTCKHCFPILKLFLHEEKTLYYPMHILWRRSLVLFRRLALVSFKSLEWLMSWPNSFLKHLGIKHRMCVFGSNTGSLCLLDTNFSKLFNLVFVFKLYSNFS